MYSLQIKWFCRLIRRSINWNYINGPFKGYKNRRQYFIFTWNISKTFEYSNQVPIYFVKSKLSIPRKLACLKNIFFNAKRLNKSWSFSKAEYLHMQKITAVLKNHRHLEITYLTWYIWAGPKVPNSCLSKGDKACQT